MTRRIKLYGDKGADVEIIVPCGITVIREDGNVFLGEVNKENDRLLVAAGGKGGDKRNNGEICEKFFVHLDLKLIADVGLVG